MKKNLNNKNCFSLNTLNPNYERLKNYIYVYTDLIIVDLFLSKTSSTNLVNLTYGTILVKTQR